MSNDDQDLKDEIAFHLQAETERRVERGESPQEARARALREFGNVPLVEEVTRGLWATATRERLVRDLRFGLRTLTRDASFSLVAIVTLALGIGATVAVFAIVNSILLRPLLFPNPDALVMVWEKTPDGSPRNLVNAPNYLAWRSRNRAFDAIGAISRIPMNISGLGPAEQVDGVQVTAEFFTALGVQPLIGRVIRSGEDVEGAPRTVVLSQQFWQQRFNGSGDVLGRMLSVNGSPFEIVGIMPASFVFPGVPTEIFIPYRINPAKPPGGRNLVTVARLKPGITLQAAQSDMERVAAETAKEDPVMNGGFSASVIPLMEQAVGDTRRILWVLFGSVACLLLLACANVANLLLMRAGTRTPEMAVRMALGAGRWGLVHQLVMESLVLTTIAGAIGLTLAWTVVPLVPAMFPPAFPLPRGNEVAVDGVVVAFTLAVAVLAGIIFGVVPAINTRQTNLSDPIRSSGRSVAGANTRVRRGLVVVEMALALVLVIGAGLMSQSLMQLYRVRPGFDTDRVLSLRMLILPAKYRELPKRVSFLNAVIAQVRATPGVLSASSVHFLPLSGAESSTWYWRSDQPEPPRDDPKHGGDVSVITEGYFKTMGIALQQGRDFSDRDRMDGPRVAIVNSTLARQWYPEGSPVGKYLSVQWSTAEPIPFEIVGVAADVRSSAIDVAPRPGIYIAHTQEPSLIATLVVRADSSPGQLAPAVRAAIARVDPDQGVSQVRTLDVLMASTTARPQIQAVVFGLFGVLALLIASVGLYGVMAYAVEQRRREMGVRLALGAAPAALLRLVVKEGLVLAGIGLVAGVLLAVGVNQSLSGLLYETRPTDPRIFAGVAAVLLAVAALATLIPARRATQVDPAMVLREQ
jgi:putative ABC transport system permease protein